MTLNICHEFHKLFCFMIHGNIFSLYHILLHFVKNKNSQPSIISIFNTCNWEQCEI